LAANQRKPIDIATLTEEDLYELSNAVMFKLIEILMG
jgi:hypothetical protein